MASPYSDKVLADGAVAYWRLDEASGNALSLVGNYPGTVTGGVTRGQTGALADGNTAMTFNGSTGYVRVPDAAALNFASDFTLEAWIKVLPNAEVDGRIIAKRSGGTGYELMIDSATGIIDLFLNGIDAVTNGSLLDNTWHHIIGLRSGTTSRVYVDGVQRGTNTVPASSTATTAGLFLARYSDDAAIRFLNGSLDEVAIYPTALTPQQITAHYALRTATSMPAWHDLRWRYCRFVRAPGWRQMRA